jgi:hypothetical protein
MDVIFLLTFVSTVNVTRSVSLLIAPAIYPSLNYAIYVYIYIYMVCVCVCVYTHKHTNIYPNLIAPTTVRLNLMPRTVQFMHPAHHLVKLKIRMPAVHSISRAATTHV